MKYTLIRTNVRAAEFLVTRIEEHLAQGWVPHGTPFVAEGDIFQALIMEEETCPTHTFLYHILTPETICELDEYAKYHNISIEALCIRALKEFVSKINNSVLIKGPKNDE